MPLTFAQATAFAEVAVVAVAAFPVTLTGHVPVAPVPSAKANVGLLATVDHSEGGTLSSEAALTSPLASKRSAISLALVILYLLSKDNKFYYLTGACR
jgi:hypothetical protein